MVCFGCGRYGHKKEDCLLLKLEKELETKKELKVRSTSQGITVPGRRLEDRVSVDDFGPWMLVRRDQRRKPQKQKSHRDEQGNRKKDAGG